MPSDAAKKAAGTYVDDRVGNLADVTKWMLQECRYGHLAGSIKKFCAEQPEEVDPALVQIEVVTSECLRCRIPCRLYDHENVHPYDSEVLFEINPVTQAVRRI